MKSIYKSLITPLALLIGLILSTAGIAGPKPSFEGAWWEPGITRHKSGWPFYEPAFVLFQRGDRICGYWTYTATHRYSGFVQAKIRLDQPNVADWTYTCGNDSHPNDRGLRDCPTWSPGEPAMKTDSGWIKSKIGPFLLCGKRLYAFNYDLPFPQGKDLCEKLKARAGYERRKINQQLGDSGVTLREVKQGLAECLSGKDPAKEWIKPARKNGLNK